MSETSQLEDDEITQLRKSLTSTLKGFSGGTLKFQAYAELANSRMDREEFPVPDLLLFMLRNVMGWKWSGRGEKVRWSVYGAFNGEPIYFELGKFGLSMLSSPALFESHARIKGQLKSAVKLVEKFMRPAIEQQVSSGNLTIGNHLSEFMSRYRFFRSQADKAFRLAENKAKEKPKVMPSADTAFPGGLISVLLEGYNRSLAARQEGFYHSVAMVDAYFSALEHRLNILRAFTGVPLPEDGFRAFMSKTWNEKLDELLGVYRTSKARKTLQEMRQIKERIRNPFAHGGYENDKGALYVHIPSIGAIPGNFTKFGKSARFSSIPVGPNDHKLNCTVFDELDELLSAGNLAAPHRLMEAGIEPSFDEKTLQSYAEAISGGEKTLEAFIEHWSLMWEQHANMDY
jgi:hypothetical protein